MPTEFKLPELGENIKFGTVTKVLVAAGDTVSKDQPVLEMETEKAVVEIPAPVAGKVTAVHVKQGDKALIGQLILTLEGTSGSVPTASRPSPAPGGSGSVPTLSPRGPIPAAPSVRQFAREIGIDIAQVPGTDPSGRISIADVKQYAKALNTSRAQPAAGGAPAVVPLPDFTKWGEVERQAMNAVRVKTAQHMGLAWSQIPHVTQFDWANITEIEERRKKLAPKVEKAGAKLTVTAILIKIVAAALKGFPKFNASVDIAKNEIVLKKFIHIGVAVETERGLLVPVIRNVDRKNIIQIAVELAQLAEKARTGKIALEDLQGGTFTITNLGGIGGTHFTPIINFPEVAILGIGRARTEPSFQGKDGCCQPRLMLPLSLSYDHRLIDGADGARFLRWIVDATEEPLLIPLEG